MAPSGSSRRAVGGVARGMLALLLAGCVTDGSITGGNPSGCTDIAYPAIMVFVTDAESGAFIGSGSRLVVQDGAFVDSIVVPAGQPHLNARALSTPGTYERPGTYTVRVRHPAYLETVAVGIQVTADACHVLTRTLTVGLLASPPTP